MKIIDSFEQYQIIKTMQVTEVEVNQKLTITMASYIYDGQLVEDETGPSFWNSNEFNNLDSETQLKIIQLVNNHIKKEII